MAARRVPPTDALVIAEREAADKVRAADQALKAALEARIKLGGASAIEELRSLATWVPGTFPHETDLYTGKEVEDDELRRLRTVPFVSEAYLYSLLGKGPARTFLAHFNSICRALGVQDYDELQRPWEEARHAEAREHARDAIEHVKALRTLGHTLQERGKTKCPVCVATTCERHRALKTMVEAISTLKEEWGEDPPT